MGRRTNEQILLDLIPVGGSIGNLSLRRTLEQRGWDEAKFWRVRQLLLDQGLIATGRGKGGSVHRVVATERAQSDEASTTGAAPTEPVESDALPNPQLRSVRYVHWKSFEDATLYVDPLTVMIGANASGKSNALDGLQFLNRIASGKEIAAALGGDPTALPLRGGIEWATLDGSSRFTLEVTISSTEPRTEYVYAISVETSPRVQIAAETLKRIRYRMHTKESPYEVSLVATDETVPENPSLTVRTYNGKGGTKRDAHRGISLLTQLVGPTLPYEFTVGLDEVSSVLKNIFILDPIPSSMRGYSPFSETLRGDAANVAGVLAALPRDRGRVVEQQLTEYIREVPERDVRHVWAEPVGRFKTDAMLYCQEAFKPKSPPTTIDARGMSDGTLRMLAIVAALLTRPEGSVLVVEEVDNGLHPSRSDVLLRVLRELGEQRRIDIVVTTHNPALLDRLGPDMVPFVIVAHRDPTTGYSLLSLLETIEQLPKLMAGGTLGSLSARGQIERALEERGRA